MASWKQQALVEAPVRDIWALVADPSRYPEYAGDVIDVTGLPTRIEKGSTYLQTSRAPLGMKVTTTFEVAELKDLQEIKLRCTRSGYYSHWLLTEARGDTFVELEVGVDPPKRSTRVLTAAHTKGFVRRMAEASVDGLRRVLDRRQAAR